MLEKDIENLIAKYPDEFFPAEELKLKGQQIKLGSCYADIIFTDKHDITIIVEVKRGILSRDAAGQIIDYYGLMKQQCPERTVELILCANVIPHERRMYLENVGIECKELRLSQIINVAQKYNYIFKDEQKKIEPQLPAGKSSEEVEDLQFVGKKIWFFQANPNRYDILNALSDRELTTQCWQINQHKNVIKKGDIALLWMSGKEAGIYAIADIISDPLTMSDFPAEEKYWVNEEDRDQKRLKVIIKIRWNLINNPLFRHELLNKEGLNNLSILKFSQGTNFPVSEKEWVVIRKMVDDRVR
jgi:hypothetical protein